MHLTQDEITKFMPERFNEKRRNTFLIWCNSYIFLQQIAYFFIKRPFSALILTKLKKLVSFMKQK